MIRVAFTLLSQLMFFALILIALFARPQAQPEPAPRVALHNANSITACSTNRSVPVSSFMIHPTLSGSGCGAEKASISNFRFRPFLGELEVKAARTRKHVNLVKDNVRAQTDRADRGAWGWSPPGPTLYVRLFAASVRTVRHGRCFTKKLSEKRGTGSGSLRSPPGILIVIDNRIVGGSGRRAFI